MKLFDFFSSTEMKPQVPHFEKSYHESLIIVLDTLEQCLSLQCSKHPTSGRQCEDQVVPSASGPTSKHDEAMNVKLLLKEICQLLDMPNDNSNMVTQIRHLTSKVLFALSINSFSAVFNRISNRLQELSVSNEENPDHTDIELIQHVDVDLQRLTKLLTEAISKFKSLKKGAYLALMNSLEKAIWNWMHNYRKF